MDYVARFLNWLKGQGSRQPEQPAETRRIEEILQGEIERLRTANPDTLHQWQSLQVALQRERSDEQVRRTNIGVRIPRLAIASALVAAVIIIAGLLFLRQPSAVLMYETGKGQISTITLADSSEVTLNHTSELTLGQQSFGTTRRVNLKGEAYFRVRKTGVPFIVSTDIAIVQVIGTDFNVRVRDDKMEVAVLTGRVRLSVEKDGRDSAVVLAAHRIVSVGRGAFPASPDQLLFPDYPGWMHGKFLFYRTSLSSACGELESKFDVAVRIEDTRLGNQTVTGAVDGRSAEAALSTLTRLTGSTYRYENGGYTLY
jgi:transmembrane sensor